MKQKKLQTFKSAAKTFKTKLEGKVVELKEDRALMQRILIVSQKRPEIDLTKLIGQYEFSVVPRSLFSFDGKLLPCNDKSQLMHAIEEMAVMSFEKSMNVTDGHMTTNSNTKVIIIDGMALVNKTEISKDVKTCKDFKNEFLRKLTKETHEFTEIRLVFDRYMEGSLKERTKNENVELLVKPYATS